MLRSFTAAALAAVLVVFSVLAPAARSVAADDGVLKATLANGLRVVIVRNTIAPVVSTVVAYEVGSRDDPDAIPGLAHAQEHMMFRGTPDLSSQQLSTIATALGGSFNAFTKPTVTEYQFTAPSATLDALLRIESDRMRDVNDAQDQWADERGAIEQEVAQNENTPGADFFRKMQQIAYAGTPYARVSVGTKAAFDALTGPQLKQFYKTWYAPNNAILVIAGDVDPQATLERVRGYFASIPRHDVPAQPNVPLAPLTRHVERAPTRLPYPAAVVAYRFPGLGQPDFLAAFLLAASLDSASGDLHALALDGRAVDAQFSQGELLPRGQLAFAIAALPPDGNPVAMDATIERIMANYAKNGVPPEIFEGAKRRILAAQELSRNSISALADDWASVIAVDKEPSIEAEVQELRAVTLAQVNAAAKAYLNPAHAIVAALTPNASPDANADLRPPERGKEAPLPQPQGAVALPAWAQPIVNDVSVPRSNVAPTVTTLPNGVHLIVQPETISRNVVVFGAVRSNAALQEPPGQEGVSTVLETLFNYGTAKHDRRAYQRLLDQIAANEDGGTRFGLQITNDNFERGVGLLAENVLEPRFLAPEFTQARNVAMNEVATSLNGSHTVARQLLMRKLYPANDPTLRLPSQASMTGLTLEDVRRYYTSVFRPDLATIVVVGNVTPDRAQRAIAAAFGNWHAPQTPVGDLTLPAVPLNAGGDVKISPPGLRTDGTTLAQLLPIHRDDPRWYTLDLANVVFGGGSGGPQSSRLFRDLRTNSGLVYSVNSSLSGGKTRASLEVEYASAPESAARAKEIVLRDIRALQTDLVPPDELQLAKAVRVRQLGIAESDENQIASRLLGDALEGLPIDEPTVAGGRYLATTQAALRDVFRAAVRPDAFVTLTEGP